MRNILPLLLCLVLFSAPLYAQDSKPQETPKVEKKKSLEQLIKELGHNDYETREAATQELIERGQKEISKQVKNVKTKIEDLFAKTKDPEVKARSRYILEKLKDVIKPKAKSQPKSSNPFKALPNIPRKVPMPALPKEFDLGKLFGGQDLDLDKMMEQMGVPKEFGDTLKKLFEGGGNGDMSKLFEDLLKGQMPQAPAPKVKKDVPPSPKDFFGIAWSPLSPALKSQLKIENGIVVAEIAKGSYAEKSGLKKADIILTVRGKAVNEPKELRALKKSGGEVVVLRSGKKVKLKFKQWK